MPEAEGLHIGQNENSQNHRVNNPIIEDAIEDFEREHQKSVQEYVERKKRLGATILSSVGFERRHDIVESSFNRARQRGEKLSGKNNERRNYAYIERLESLVGEHGNNLEKRLWRASVSKLIIKPEDIQDSYWKMQEQILRDNGQGRELSDYEKEVLTEDIQKQQRESAQAWSDYLGDANSPYPMWFKLYAWDGMSKMGVFDTDKKQFTKRNPSTVAPYPKLNPAALAKVHGAIADFYGIADSDRYTEGEEQDMQLASLIKAGNFNRLYSKMLLETKTIVKTPERTEDIDGEWVEYLPGNEESLAEAAEGTPWCIADPGTGRNYLEYGDYAGGYDNERVEDSRAKFILFRLHDPTTKQLATNACASIRLGTDGNVAEVSGLNDGQALEDPLIPIVEEKVKSLPGGEKFLAAFADKKQLITLDRKFQNGEPFTDDDLNFIFETNRKIISLDTYRSRDPRIKELRDIENLLKNGTNVDSVLSVISDRAAAANLEILLSSGANVDNAIEKMGVYIGETGTIRALLNYGVRADDIVDKMFGEDIFSLSGERKTEIADDGTETDRPVRNLELLMNAGANIELILNKLGWQSDLDHFDELTRYGAEIDINEVASHLSPEMRLEKLDILVERGATIDIDDIVNGLDTVRDKDVEKLVSNGANAEAIVKKITPSSMSVENFRLLASSIEDPTSILDLVNARYSNEVEDLFKVLLDLDADPNALLSSEKFPNYTIEKHAKELLAKGGDSAVLVEQMSPGAILENLDLLIEHNAPIDVKKVIASNYGYALAPKANWLLNNGADVATLVAKFNNEEIDETFDTLIKHGANIDDLVRKMNEDTTYRRFGTLLAHGADIDLMVQNLSEDTTRQHAGELLEQGVDINLLLQRIPSLDISEIQSMHDELGASFGALVPKLSEESGKKGLDVLLDHSDEVDFQAIASELDPDMALNNFNRIQEKGVTLSLEEIVNKSSGPAILRNLDMIKNAGISVDINKIVSNLRPYYVFEYVEKLLDNGADPRLVLEHFPKTINFLTPPDPLMMESKSAALRRAREAVNSMA